MLQHHIDYERNRVREKDKKANLNMWGKKIHDTRATLSVFTERTLVKTITTTTTKTNSEKE